MGFASDVNIDRISKKNTFERYLGKIKIGTDYKCGPLGTALHHILMKEREELIKEKLPEPLNAIQKRLNAIDD